ncbi:MAG: COX15/CtaA family protein [Flavobacteriaceae bacterium]|nr:COX15/CtaA family protein [Flavobacteriaceae bacterium]
MIQSNYKYTKTIRIWLIIGLIMLLGQVVLGGITRLTGSGLSITRWDIVSGTIPPLNAEQWNDAFDLYKQTPQYHKINKHFTLSDFKFIFFWEYFHRLWVRILGFIFLIPFIVFIIKKKIDFYLVKRLLLVVLFAALTASAGWIMVKSGLVDRPWVNAYKLTLHFILAVLSIGMMVKTIADVYNYGGNTKNLKPKALNLVIAITFIQLIFAGLMSGMKAGLYYPSWPDMNGDFIPQVLSESKNWTLHNLTNYDSFLFAPALIQFTHRILAYLLVPATIYMYFLYRKELSKISSNWLNSSVLLICLQLILGILIVLNINPGIPLFYGVLHQLVGLLFFTSLLFLKFSLRKDIK